jgi:rRNA-processing protein FCF1
MEKNKVILDTSVLLIPGRTPSRDIFMELLKLLGNYEAVIPRYVMNELEGIKNNPKKARKIKDAAKLAISLVDKMISDSEISKAVRTGMDNESITGFAYEIKIEEAEKSKKTVDDSLIDFSKKLGARLCTSDKELIKKAEKNNVQVLFLGALKYPKRSRTKK